MKWNEFKTMVDKYLAENNLSEDTEIEEIDFMGYGDDIEIRKEPNWGIEIRRHGYFDIDQPGESLTSQDGISWN